MRILTVLLLGVYSTLYSQETKFIFKDSDLRNGIDFKEEYYVLKEDKKTKHGTYVKYRQQRGQIAIIESGTYINGEKHGLWETFHNSVDRKLSNSIEKKGNYINGKKNGVWTYYYLDTVASVTNIEEFTQKKKIDSVSINIDQRNTKLKQVGMFLNDKRVAEWTTFDYNGNLIQKCNLTTSRILFDSTIKDSLQYNTNRIPLFVGGYQDLKNFLSKNNEWTGTLPKIDKDSIHAIIAFTINDQGNTENISINSTAGNKKFDEELTKLISLTDSNWLPGLKDGLKVNYQYKIRYDVARIKTSSDSRWWRWVSLFTVLE